MTQPNPVLAENHHLRNELMKLQAKNLELKEEILTLKAELDKQKLSLSEEWGEE